MSQTTPGPTGGDGTSDAEEAAEEATDGSAEEAIDDSTEETAKAATDDDAETPDVEEDLVSEELRIDGICGVY